MALTPWHVAQLLWDHEAGALLAGHHDVNPWAESWAEIDTALIAQWVDRMIEAAHRNEIWLLEIQASTQCPRSMSPKKQPKEVPFDRPVTMEELVQEKLRNVIFKVERQEVYRWLRASGVSDAEIPAAFRIMPEAKKAGDDGRLDPKREATYQRVIAALMVLQYGYREIEKPYEVTDEMLKDFKLNNIKEPASRSTLGPILKNLPPVQKADLD